MEKELDVLEIKAEALAANIMHRDGYIVKDEQGYTWTGGILSAVFNVMLHQDGGEEAINKVIALFEANAKEIKD